MESKSILIEAESIVNGERAKDYGDAVEQFGKVANIVNLMLDYEEKERLQYGTLTDSVCVKVLIAVKIARHANAPKHDNLVDLCGYTEILNRIQESE